MRYGCSALKLKNDNMGSIENKVGELVRLVSQYKIKEALTQFYFKDFHAYKNTEGPRIGIDKPCIR